MRANDVASDLIALVTESLHRLETNHAHGLVLPNVFAGHVTDELASADLAYVAGLLSSLGVEEIAGVSTAEVCVDVIGLLDPSRVEDFAAYRIGETALRLGGLEALDGDVAERAALAALPTETVRAVRAGERP
ncbi:MAG: hypothetical protein IH940_12680, partial [Acidobacteria bacterium]|nr:hypothetical protein [Acidobacteriota bacterium]